MNKFQTLLFLLLFQCFLTASAQSPSKIELVHANILEGDDQFGKDVRRLLGDVTFKQENTFMYCDSAYLYASTNSLDAYGHVRIVQGDTINLTGDVLKYNGNTRQARLLNNIVLIDRTMTLTSQNLNYNLDTGVADYSEGGKIVDTDNVLTSDRGYYFSKEKKLSFRKNVVLLHPGYRMETDTLVYYTVSKISEFYGPCYIRSNDSSYIYCENGWYNTITDKSFFSRNAYISSKEQTLKGDSLFYDNKLQRGEAFSNVLISDTLQKIEVFGDYGFYNRATGKSFITGHLLMKRAFDADTLFAHADSIHIFEDTLTHQKSVFAYHHVRMYKKDLQAVCDSVVYTSADSTMRMYVNPVLWSDKNQLTADSVSLVVSNKSMERMYLYNTAFITSMEDTIRFNQLRGKNMIGYFTDNNLTRIEVFGNGQSIYYARNKKDQLTGVNRADCSNMIILIKDNKVSKLKLIEKPDATFYPINELSPNELKLKGFTWQEEKRPVDKNDIYRKNY
ncbi:MAG: hypothetical protein HS118_04680 [Bacteroidia bacterium]|nr:hypothetical protein [Bacteroidia bacterium]MCE7954038.1 hypothetical protein [Bacteroidetes bacterium CHB6]